MEERDAVSGFARFKLLHFVNRETAAQQLHDIHQRMFERAKVGFGEEWVIPLAENVSGQETELDAVEWNEEEMPVYSICGRESDMYFVNRTNAVKRLYTIFTE